MLLPRDCASVTESPMRIVGFGEGFQVSKNFRNSSKDMRPSVPFSAINCKTKERLRRRRRNAKLVILKTASHRRQNVLIVRQLNATAHVLQFRQIDVTEAVGVVAKEHVIDARLVRDGQLFQLRFHLSHQLENVSLPVGKENNKEKNGELFFKKHFLNFHVTLATLLAIISSDFVSEIVEGNVKLSHYSFYC